MSRMVTAQVIAQAAEQRARLRPSRAGSSRRSARPAAAAWDRKPGRGRSRPGAAHRRAGCAPARSPSLPEPTYASRSWARAWASASSLWNLRVRISASAIVCRKRGYMPTSTFSMTVIAPNRRIFWKVRAMPSEVIWSERSPTSGCPSKRIVPSSGLYRSGQGVEEGRLAGPVGTDDADDLALFQHEIHAVDRLQPAKALGNSLGFQ